MRGFFWKLAIVILVSVPSWNVRAEGTTFQKSVHSRTEEALEKLEADGDFDAAAKILGEIFDQCTLYSRDQADALTEAAMARRLVAQLQRVPTEDRKELLKFLRGHPQLAAAMVFLKHPEKEDAGRYRVLNELRQQRGELLEKYATLAAAICVVHHKPLQIRINENTAKATTPLALFDYYTQNEGKMFFGIRGVPTELLEYVVDTTASVDEMAWALKRYAGDKDIGKHFFDVPYDYDNFLKGTPKKITLLGFTLLNILQYGGVCADQAYFASEIAKAIGVPSAYDTGSSGEVAHAWVGFLRTDGRAGWWDFDSGRYEEYQGVRGNVRDPATGAGIPDSYVSLLSELIKTSPAQRYQAVALTDAAVRLIEWETQGTVPDMPAPVASDVRKTARKAEVADELDLIEAALNQSPGYAPAWFEVRDLATAHKLSDAQKNLWADVLLRLGAKRYPDFTLAILTPMIQSIDDPTQQDRLWNNVLFPLFQTRFDLAAAIRMHEAAMWNEHDQPTRAGQCYMDVIDRYANAGPFVLEAIKGAEKLLVQTQHNDRVVLLYAQAWSKTKPPRQMAQQFGTQSNWYHVGKTYAKKLREAGDIARADMVEGQLQKVTMVASP